MEIFIENKLKEIEDQIEGVKDSDIDEVFLLDLKEKLLITFPERNVNNFFIKYRDLPVESDAFRLRLSYFFMLQEMSV